MFACALLGVFLLPACDSKALCAYLGLFRCVSVCAHACVCGMRAMHDPNKVHANLTMLQAGHERGTC